MGESNSLAIIDRVRSEIRIARSTSQIQEVIARSLNVFIKVVDELNIPQRRITLEGQGVEQLRHTVLESRLNRPTYFSAVVAGETSSTDDNVRSNKGWWLRDRRSAQLNRTTIATDIDVIVESEDNVLVDEQLGGALSSDAS